MTQESQNSDDQNEQEPEHIASKTQHQEEEEETQENFFLVCSLKEISRSATTSEMDINLTRLKEYYLHFLFYKNFEV